MLFDLLFLSAAVLLHGRTAMARAGTPCQSVSSMSAAYTSMFPEATTVLVDADVAAACLKSVPVNVEEDKLLLEELQLYLNWQSNLAWLANPPEGYKEDRVDLEGQLKKISEDLDSGKYEDEYTLQVDIKMAFDKTYDFHTNWNPDILSVFQFQRGNAGHQLADEFALVSVSSDGKALPELYNYYDILFYPEENWRNPPSPIVSINNQSAEQYVQDWSARFPFLENHARYNQLFPNQPSISQGYGFTTEFGRSPYYSGETTIVEYKNGTVQELLNVASVLKDFTGVEDGETFFEAFCNRGPDGVDSRKKRDVSLTTTKKTAFNYRDDVFHREKEAIAATKVKRQESEPTATGYPVAEILHSEAAIGGYYLSGQGYEDVAVLAVPSFGPEDTVQFQDLIGTFLETASSAGKTKLVIDLRGNGGGTLFLGYDMFKQLFPSQEPWGANRFQANQAFDIVGQFYTDALKDITYEQAFEDYQKNGDEASIAEAYHSMFNYKIPIDVDGKNFTSWQEYFGPHEVNGANFTTISRWDLWNFFSDDLGLDVTGYASRAADLKRKQFFEAKDIVMLQDGGCGSTCAIFAEFAKFQGGVQQVVVGGRPETGPMQGVAGSKGSQVYTFSQIRREASVAYRNLEEYQEQLDSTEIGQLLAADRPLMRVAYTSGGTPRARVNLRDHIRKGDDTETPLEFVYEAADCRFFYTAEMIADPVPVWKKAVDAHWGDPTKECVEGSTGQLSSLSGGLPTAAEIENPAGGEGKDVLGNRPKGAATRIGGGVGAITSALVAVVAMMLMW